MCVWGGGPRGTAVPARAKTPRACPLSETLFLCGPSSVLPFPGPLPPRPLPGPPRASPGSWKAPAPPTPRDSKRKETQVECRSLAFGASPAPPPCVLWPPDSVWTEVPGRDRPKAPSAGATRPAARPAFLVAGWLAGWRAGGLAGGRAGQQGLGHPARPDGACSAVSGGQRPLLLLQRARSLARWFVHLHANSSAGSGTPAKESQSPKWTDY